MKMEPNDQEPRGPSRRKKLPVNGNSTAVPKASGTQSQATRDRSARTPLPSFGLSQESNDFPQSNTAADTQSSLSMASVRNHGTLEPENTSSQPSIADPNTLQNLARSALARLNLLPVDFAEQTDTSRESDTEVFAAPSLLPVAGAEHTGPSSDSYTELFPAPSRRVLQLRGRNTLAPSADSSQPSTKTKKAKRPREDQSSIDPRIAKKAQPNPFQDTTPPTTSFSRQANIPTPTPIGARGQALPEALWSLSSTHEGPRTYSQTPARNSRHPTSEPYYQPYNHQLAQAAVESHDSRNVLSESRADSEPGRQFGYPSANLVSPARQQTQNGRSMYFTPPGVPRVRGDTYVNRFLHSDAIPSPSRNRVSNGTSGQLAPASTGRPHNSTNSSRPVIDLTGDDETSSSRSQGPSNRTRASINSLAIHRTPRGDFTLTRPPGSINPARGRTSSRASNTNDSEISLASNIFNRYFVDSEAEPRAYVSPYGSRSNEFSEAANVTTPGLTMNPPTRPFDNGMHNLDAMRSGRNSRSANKSKVASKLGANPTQSMVANTTSARPATQGFVYPAYPPPYPALAPAFGQGLADWRQATPPTVPQSTSQSTTRRKATPGATPTSAQGAFASIAPNQGPLQYPMPQTSFRTEDAAPQTTRQQGSGREYTSPYTQSGPATTAFSQGTTRYPLPQRTFTTFDAYQTAHQSGSRRETTSNAASAYTQSSFTTSTPAVPYIQRSAFFDQAPQVAREPGSRRGTASNAAAAFTQSGPTTTPPPRFSTRSHLSTLDFPNLGTYQAAKAARQRESRRESTAATASAARTTTAAPRGARHIRIPLPTIPDPVEPKPKRRKLLPTEPRVPKATPEPLTMSTRVPQAQREPNDGRTRGPDGSMAHPEAAGEIPPPVGPGNWPTGGALTKLLGWERVMYDNDYKWFETFGRINHDLAGYESNFKFDVIKKRCDKIFGCCQRVWPNLENSHDLWTQWLRRQTRMHAIIDANENRMAGREMKLVVKTRKQKEAEERGEIVDDGEWERDVIVEEGEEGEGVKGGKKDGAKDGEMS